MTSPQVSVLMPVYNGADYLALSIRSVLRQKFRDFELLVIDDSSRDDSAGIARGFKDSRIRVLQNERNLGLVGTLNRGLEEARAPLVARQDQDDWSHPERLGAQSEFLSAHPQMAAVGSDAVLVGSSGGYSGRWRTGGDPILVRWDLLFRTPFPHSSAMFHREIVHNELSGYRDFQACEDFDLWSRMADNHELATERTARIRYRQHAGSMMRVERASRARRGREALRQIITNNLANAVPSVDTPLRETIADAWADCEMHDWQKYFDAVRAVESEFFRHRDRPADLRTILGEQNFSIFCREAFEGRGETWLRMLRENWAEGFAALPMMRVRAVRMMAWARGKRGAA